MSSSDELEASDEKEAARGKPKKKAAARA